MVAGAPLRTKVLEHHSDKVTDVVYIPDDDVFITGSKDTTLALWRNKNGMYEVVFRRGVRRPVSKLSYSPGGMLLAGFYNGNVNRYQVKPGMSGIEHIKTYENHTDRVTDIIVCEQANCIFTCSRDRTLSARRASTMEMVATQTFADWATCLQYCSKSNVIFVGIATGQIHLFSISPTGELRELHVLKGHATVVTRLLWLNGKGWLCSASEDSRIVVWDIAGKSGLSYELNAHTTPVRSICYIANEDEIISLDDSNSLVVWDMGRHRRPANEWMDSDTCQLCGRYFFWVMAFPPNTARQHHCRRCGMALCGSCLPLKKPFPRGGFELPVYICKKCAPSLTPEDLAPTIERFILPSATNMQWIPETRTLFTITTENTVVLYKFEGDEVALRCSSSDIEWDSKGKGKQSSGIVREKGSSDGQRTDFRSVINCKDAACVPLSKSTVSDCTGDSGDNSRVSANKNVSGRSDMKDGGNGSENGSGSLYATLERKREMTENKSSSLVNTEKEAITSIETTVENRTESEIQHIAPTTSKRRPLKSAFGEGLFDSEDEGIVEGSESVGASKMQYKQSVENDSVPSISALVADTSLDSPSFTHHSPGTNAETNTEVEDKIDTLAQFANQNKAHEHTSAPASEDHTLPPDDGHKDE
eukprot:CFRG7044T1